MSDRYSGPFETANVAGMVLAGALIVVMGLMSFTASAARLRWGWGYAIWTVLGLSAVQIAMLLLATGCRAVLLGLACCIPLVCRLPTGRQLADWKTAILLALAVVVPLVLGGMFLTEPTSGFRRWLDLDLASASVTHRLLVWQAALVSIVQHPFVGLGRTGYAQTSDLWRLPAGVRDLYDGALSVPLTLWAETGLWILLPVLGLSVASFLVGMSLRQATGVGSRIAALTGCSLLLTTWICGLFQVHHRLGWWWWLLASALVLIWFAQFRAQGWNPLARSSHRCLARTAAWTSVLTFGILGAVYSTGCMVSGVGYAELQSGATSPVVWLHPLTSANGQRILLGIDDGVDPHRWVDAIGKPLLQGKRPIPTG